MYSTHEGKIAIPNRPPAACTVHIIPVLTSHFLLSIGQLCDAGCIAKLTATNAIIRHIMISSSSKATKHQQLNHGISNFLRLQSRNPILLSVQSLLPNSSSLPILHYFSNQPHSRLHEIKDTFLIFWASPCTTPFAVTSIPLLLRSKDTSTRAAKINTKPRGLFENRCKIQNIRNEYLYVTLHCRCSISVIRVTICCRLLHLSIIILFFMVV